MLRYVALATNPYGSGWKPTKDALGNMGGRMSQNRDCSGESTTKQLFVRVRPKLTPPCTVAPFGKRVFCVRLKPSYTCSCVPNSSFERTTTRPCPKREGTTSYIPHCCVPPPSGSRDRKSTRLNSSHLVISYAV